MDCNSWNLVSRINIKSRCVSYFSVNSLQSYALLDRYIEICLRVCFTTFSTLGRLQWNLVHMITLKCRCSWQGCKSESYVPGPTLAWIALWKVKEQITFTVLHGLHCILLNTKSLVNLLGLYVYNPVCVGYGGWETRMCGVCPYASLWQKLIVIKFMQ